MLPGALLNLLVGRRSTRLLGDTERGAMNADEQAIRELVTLWHAATVAGDVDTVISLMADDVIFLVPSKPPMQGRSAFERGLRNLLTQHRIESTAEVREVEVSGNLAYCWSNLHVRIVPLSGGNGTVRAGSALSMFRKEVSGAWVLIRDANLLAETS